MYLKRIMAHGFKSFADKIEIDLTNGITGVVGPNGSGKSNVVDAVRWVLGEQSVKSLRGEGNMTDVIFSGSKSRNALNVASVTLVFDNHDHYLPLDFDEVAIKRMVYKDGTNEFYINKEHCRLKDITDILMDSGIAKESFNIISQGKIEEILSSKPSDRRVIFEEAASVLKYKKRKEEAIRKLDRTHDNMNRVTDIIGELERQVEPLKEEKEKAILYTETKEELEGIEIALIVSDITNLNFKYQQDKKRIASLNETIMKLSTNQSKEEAELESLKVELNELDKQIQKLQKDLMEQTSLVEQINGQKQIVLERQKYAVEDAKLHQNMVSLKESILKLENQIESVTREITGLQEKGHINASKNADFTKKLEETKKKKGEVELRLSRLVREDGVLQSKIERLTDSIDHNGTLPQSVQMVLNNPKLRGIHDAIGNIIEVDETYATAIATSLGASSSYVIVESEACAKEAITYLKNNHLGRVTFFPQNVIKPKGIDSDTQSVLANQEGFIDVASNLVHYDKTYHNIVLNQLGNVIVASDIDCANQIAKKIQYRYKIVTLDGELLHVGGSITGGTAKARNMISDKYELELALKEKEEIRKSIQDCENEINEIDYKLRSIEDAFYLFHKEELEDEEQIRLKQKHLEALSQEASKMESDISLTKHVMDHTLNEEENHILESYYQAVKEKEDMTSLLETLEKKRNSMSDSIEEYEYARRKENSEFTTLNKELKDLEISVNRMDVKLDTLLTNLSETYSMTYEKASMNYHLELEPNVARNKVNGLKNVLKNIGIVNLNAPIEYEKVSERYEFLLSQKEDLIGAENTLLEIIKEMDDVMEKSFLDTFHTIQNNFKETFKELFRGGYAELKLTDPTNILDTGIDIIASPPGKKLTSINLLSGGEKTFTAISLLFAILKSRPVPFCILDEVEAALDEVNVDSFGQYLMGLKDKTQFILITHKKKTMEYADILYGITMQESGVSKLVSVKLEELPK